MLATVDWYGISAVIAAIGAAAATIIGALNHNTAATIRRSVSTNGDPRTLGQIATDVANATPGAEAPTTPPPTTPPAAS